MRKYGRIKMAVFNVACACVFAIIALCFTGCGADVRISLTVGSISLNIGESRDVMPYVVFEPAIDVDKTVTISCDTDELTIAGTTVTARKAGVATLSVKSKYGSAKMTVEVGSAQPTGLSIIGELLQTATDVPHQVALGVVSDGGSLADVEWTAEGVPIGKGESVVFTPPGYGEFAVTAALNGLETSAAVRVYRNTSVDLVVTGALDQTDGSFSPVTFVATERLDSLNPVSVFEWLVNGESGGYGKRFDFTPCEQGEYTVSLKLNGKEKPFTEAGGIKITAQGERAPIGYVDIDGGVHIRWDDGMNIARVSVFSPDGRRKNIEMTDAQHAYRFGKGSFNADGIIDPFAEQPGEYRIILAADGTSEFNFMQYPSEAEKYVTSTVFCRNSFISDEQDAALWVKELYITGKRSGTCYPARGAQNIPAAVLEAASILGLNASVTEHDGKLDVSFDTYVNTPTVIEEVDDSLTSLTRYTMLPHIEYDITKLRGSSYTLAIDRSHSSVRPTNSEQLLYAVMNGYKPETSEGSHVDTVYSAARAILLATIGSSFTDEQKVHAIYDWLQWTCVAANGVAANSSARFIDGLFGSPEIEGAGRATRTALTDEGAAKAFAFLCAIEGIDVTIEHDGVYYNTVELDGLIYIVDVIGGKLITYTGTRRNELSSHIGLFLPDGYAPDESLSYSLKKYRYGGKFFDYYIDRRELNDTDMLDTAIAYAFSRARLGSVRVPSVPAVNATFTVARAGIEFVVCAMNDDERQTLTKNIANAIKTYVFAEYGTQIDDSAIDITFYGTDLHISALMPQRNTDGE